MYSSELILCNSSTPEFSKTPHPINILNQLIKRIEMPHIKTIKIIIDLFKKMFFSRKEYLCWNRQKRTNDVPTFFVIYNVTCVAKSHRNYSCECHLFKRKEKECVSKQRKVLRSHHLSPRRTRTHNVLEDNFQNKIQKEQAVIEDGFMEWEKKSIIKWMRCHAFFRFCLLNKRPVI